MRTPAGAKAVWPIIGAAVVAVAAVVVPATGGEPTPAAQSRPEDFQLSGDMEHGAVIFARSCAACHGANGDGRGVVKIPDLEMPDLRDGAFLKSRSDWELYQVVKVGGVCNQKYSDKMPATGSRLGDQEIHDVVAYVRTLPVLEYIRRERAQ